MHTAFKVYNNVKTLFFLSFPVSVSTLITVFSVAAAACVLCLACIVCCGRRSANANRKKKHNFGIRKTGYFRVKKLYLPGVSSNFSRELVKANTD